MLLELVEKVLRVFQKLSEVSGGGDTTLPGHVANDDNPPVPPQADPAPRPHGEDVTLDPDL